MRIEDVLFINELPRECVEDCSRGGVDAAPAVQHWRETLDFTVNRGKAIGCLAGYGAWDREELEASDDDDIADKVLWLACGDFSEFITECERAGIDPYGNIPDDFDPAAGSDIFVLE